MLTKLVNSTLVSSSNNRFWERKVRKPLVKKFGPTALAPEERDGASLRETIKKTNLQPIMIRRSTH